MPSTSRWIDVLNPDLPEPTDGTPIGQKTSRYGVSKLISSNKTPSSRQETPLVRRAFRQSCSPKRCWDSASRQNASRVVVVIRTEFEVQMPSGLRQPLWQP